MKLPTDIDVIETTCYHTWMGDDGICRTLVKDQAEVTMKEARENSEAVRSYDQGGSKYPLIVFAQNIKSITKEARDFLSIRGRQSPVCSIAIIVKSPLSRVIGNFFIGMNRAGVPSKLFTDEEAAVKWSKKILS